MLKGRDMETMLHKYIPTMYEKEFPMNIHEKSYLDLFPKQKLVYLTPHCREEMDTFDHDAVYIVGAIVDKVSFCKKKFYQESILLIQQVIFLQIFNYRSIMNLSPWQKQNVKALL